MSVPVTIKLISRVSYHWMYVSLCVSFYSRLLSPTHTQAQTTPGQRGPASPESTPDSASAELPEGWKRNSLGISDLETGVRPTHGFVTSPPGAVGEYNTEGKVSFCLTSPSACVTVSNIITEA